jgi:hypothetical protein
MYPVPVMVPGIHYSLHSRIASQKEDELGARAAGQGLHLLRASRFRR